MVQRTVLGRDILLGQKLQYTVPAGSWFGAMLTQEATEDRPFDLWGDEDSASADYPYSLVGCTVAPGFDFGDFELAEPSLLTQFPQALGGSRLLRNLIAGCRGGSVDGGSRRGSMDLLSRRNSSMDGGGRRVIGSGQQLAEASM